MAKTGKRRSAEQAEGLARRIWLAGLGAYGTSMEDAHGPLGRAGEEASRLFQELVEKGQRIEEQNRDALRNRLDEARHRISERAQSNTRSVEEMIQRVREKIGIEAAVAAPLDALTRRVDGIARRLGAGASVRGKPAVKPTAASAGRSGDNASKKPRTSRKATSKAGPRSAPVRAKKTVKTVIRGKAVSRTSPAKRKR